MIFVLSFGKKTADINRRESGGNGWKKFERKKGKVFNLVILTWKSPKIIHFQTKVEIKYVIIILVLVALPLASSGVGGGEI